jgi:hypothetical protein
MLCLLQTQELQAEAMEAIDSFAAGTFGGKSKVGLLVHTMPSVVMMVLGAHTSTSISWHACVPAHSLPVMIWHCPQPACDDLALPTACL